MNDCQRTSPRVIIIAFWKAGWSDFAFPFEVHDLAISAPCKSPLNSCSRPSTPSSCWEYTVSHHPRHYRRRQAVSTLGAYHWLLASSWILCCWSQHWPWKFKQFSVYCAGHLSSLYDFISKITTDTAPPSICILNTGWLQWYFGANKHNENDTFE